MNDLTENRYLQIVLLEIEKDAMKFLHGGTQDYTYTGYTEQVAAIHEAISKDIALTIATKEATL